MTESGYTTLFLLTQFLSESGIRIIFTEWRHIFLKSYLYKWCICFGISTITLAKEEKTGTYIQQGRLGAWEILLDYNGKCRVKVEVLPPWKYLYYHGIKLTLRFPKFITCSCLYWLFMRGFIQGEIHNCSIFTGKEPLMVRVGVFLPTYWWQMLAKCVTDRKVKKCSFCLCGVTIANVMFAYFEIKNQYTITISRKNISQHLL